MTKEQIRELLKAFEDKSYEELANGTTAKSVVEEPVYTAKAPTTAPVVNEVPTYNVERPVRTYSEPPQQPSTVTPSENARPRRFY